MAHHVTIRPEQHDDAHAIRHVVAAAFGSPAEADLVDRIRASPEYRPDYSLVAEVDGDVVGHVMVSGATLRATDGADHPIVMLSPLAVAPEWQRAGVGGALVRAVTTLAGERGEPFVVLEGSPEYYGRFGFEPATDYSITMPLPDWAPVEAAQLLPLPAFDRAATPAGCVVYPPAFDGLE